MNIANGIATHNGAARQTESKGAVDHDRSDASSNGHDVPRSSRSTASSTTFNLVLRPRLKRESDGRLIDGESSRAAFERALGADTNEMDEPLITWREREKLVALDFDRPDHAARLCDADIDSIMVPNAPTPAYAWVTHGGGLRVIFCMVNGVSALALAGVWLMLAQLRQLAAWRLEVKTDTRHPAGLREGAVCGRVFSFDLSEKVSLLGTGDVSQVEIDSWLDAHDLTIGRHRSDLCPWSCGRSSGSPPVSVTEAGVRCFRCGRSACWPELVGGVDGTHNSLFRAARGLVHLGHQKHVIRALYPIVPEDLIKPAWGHLLRLANADDLADPSPTEKPSREERVLRASSDALDVARSSAGGWVDSTTLNPRKVTDKTLRYLSWCAWAPMIEKAGDTGPLEHFTPLHVIDANAVLGPGVSAPRGTVLARRPRAHHEPTEVNLSFPPSSDEIEDAWKVVEGALPGVNRGYHTGVVIAMLIAQRGVGTPPIICATGQSGSAKTAQVFLAAGALGSKAVQIALGTTDDTTRKAGLALEEGAGVLFADEIGRVEGIFKKLEPILSANSELSYRPKYSNERRMPLRSAVLLLGSTLPEAIVRSPELARRSVGYRLTGADKRWTLLDKSESKIDLSAARCIEWLRPALDTITAAAWWAVHDLGPNGDWRQLLIDSYDAVPLPHLDLVDPDGTGQASAIVALYDAYRTAQPNELSKGSHWNDWLIANPGTSHGEQLAVLVEPDADIARFKAATSDLERLNLHPILGFAVPQLQLLIRRRARNTLVKFVPVKVLRGRVTRGELPPLIPPTAGGDVETLTVTL